ncbi:hypothetical protein [Mesorhizobium sp. M0859]|uniref:hypothetical protein n=1 Tax=Mesorhizobium sp. M0859 TaxID=2957014 RepID=UPI003338B8CE
MCGPFEGAGAAMIEARISGTGLRLADVTERHMAAQRAASNALNDWDERRGAGALSDIAYASAVSAVATEEATARREVMTYQPIDYEECKRPVCVHVLSVVQNRSTSGSFVAMEDLR